MDRLLAQRASHRHRERLRRLKLLAVGIVLGALLGALLFGQSAAGEHGVKIVAIGTGDGISTLITAGHQRILVVAGNDGEALEGVLAGHLRWNQRIFDLVLIASDGDDMAIRNAVRELNVKTQWDLEGAGGTRQPALPARIELLHGLVGTFEVEPGSLSRPRDWLLKLERDGHRLAVIGGASRWSGDRVSAWTPNVVIVSSGESGVTSDGPIIVLAAQAAELQPTRSRSVRLVEGGTLMFQMTGRGIEVDLPDDVRPTVTSVDTR